MSASLLHWPHSGAFQHHSSNSILLPSNFTSLALFWCLPSYLHSLLSGVLHLHQHSSHHWNLYDALHFSTSCTIAMPPSCTPQPPCMCPHSLFFRHIHLSLHSGAYHQPSSALILLPPHYHPIHCNPSHPMSLSPLPHPSPFCCPSLPSVHVHLLCNFFCSVSLPSLTSLPYS